MTITKDKTRTGDARYRCRVVVGHTPAGNPIQKMRSFHKRKDAEAWGREMESNRDHGIALQPAKLRLSEYLQQWLDRAAKRVRPSTLYGYQYVVDTHIPPALAGTRLADLSRATLQAWIDGLPTADTARRAHNVLHNALAEAADLELIHANPAHGLKLPRAPSSSATAWSKEEARRFLAAVADAPYWPYWPLAVRLGLRPSELLALRWSSVDLEAGTAIIREATPIIAAKRFEGVPKSLSGFRTLDLPADLVAVLLVHKMRQAPLRLKLGPAWPDLVCTDAHGLAVHYRELWKIYQRLMERAAVPHIRLYDLRHTAISIMAESGADMKAISEVAGHANVRITRQVYQHINREQRRAALAALGDALVEPEEKDDDQEDQGKAL